MIEFSLLDFAVGIIGGFACLTVLIVLWFGPGYWAVRDAYRRGSSPGIVVMLWPLFGPFSALVWLATRPSTTLVNRAVEQFLSAEDALSAAARLDRIGEW